MTTKVRHVDKALADVLAQLRISNPDAYRLLRQLARLLATVDPKKR